MLLFQLVDLSITESQCHGDSAERLIWARRGYRVVLC